MNTKFANILFTHFCIIFYTFLTQSQREIVNEFIHFMCLCFIYEFISGREEEKAKNDPEVGNIDAKQIWYS